MKRGTVVIVQFPYTDGSQGKRRPALIIQNDRDNARLATTIIAMISGNIEHAKEPTQLLIDPTTEDGAPSGLHGPSVVKCNNLFTIRKADILKKIGHLPDTLMTATEQCLQAALEMH